MKGRIIVNEVEFSRNFALTNLTEKELNIALLKHKLWLENKEGGEQAVFVRRKIHSLKFDEIDDLQSIVFKECMFENVNFLKKNSSNVHFKNCMLYFVMEFGNLSFATFEGCTIQYLNFEDSKLYKTKFQDCFIESIDAFKNISEAIFVDSRIEHCNRTPGLFHFYPVINLDGNYPVCIYNNGVISVDDFTYHIDSWRSEILGTHEWGFAFGTGLDGIGIREEIKEEWGKEFLEGLGKAIEYLHEKHYKKKDESTKKGDDE